jgi:hypothetical protein
MIHYIQPKIAWVDPNTKQELPTFIPRQSTLQMLEAYLFTDDSGKSIEWTSGQIEIIDCILQRSAPNGLKRIEIIASTQYGKSLAVAAGLVIRCSLKPEKWAIVAGTDEKAKIIMEYVIMLSLNSDMVRTQLEATNNLDRLRMKKSADRLTFKRKGEVKVYSANATMTTETSKSLMGFGAPNVIEDESALVGDTLQATVMRMLGGSKDNFLIKIGNPFTRGHFLRTWLNGQYYRIFIDYKRAIAEGRYSQEFINEMKDEALFSILYGCLFPESDMVDAKGWMALLSEDEVKRSIVEAEVPFGFFRLGCDVAGGGRNFSAIILRSYNLARKIYKENESDTMLFLGKIQTYQVQLGVLRDDIFVDKVGIGRGLYDRGRQLNDELNGVNGAAEPADKSLYVNLRAEMYWRARQWLLRGGKLEKDDNVTKDNPLGDWKQLTKIMYKVQSGSGKIIIMSKEEMLKNGIDSPDIADGFAMTFAKGEKDVKTANRSIPTVLPNPDPYE